MILFCNLKYRIWNIKFYLRIPVRVITQVVNFAFCVGLHFSFLQKQIQMRNGLSLRRHKRQRCYDRMRIYTLKIRRFRYGGFSHALFVPRLKHRVHSSVNIDQNILEAFV